VAKFQGKSTRPFSCTDHILSCFSNTVDTLWTLTLLQEYYTKTFTDDIIKLFTHTLNQGLTDIKSLLFFAV